MYPVAPLTTTSHQYSQDTTVTAVPGSTTRTTGLPLLGPERMLTQVFATATVPPTGGLAAGAGSAGAGGAGAAARRGGGAGVGAGSGAGAAAAGSAGAGVSGGAAGTSANGV